MTLCAFYLLIYARSIRSKRTPTKNQLRLLQTFSLAKFIAYVIGPITTVLLRTYIYMTANRSVTYFLRPKYIDISDPGTKVEIHGPEVHCDQSDTLGEETNGLIGHVTH